MTDQQKVIAIYWLMGGCIFVLLLIIPVMVSFRGLMKNVSPLKDKVKPK